MGFWMALQNNGDRKGTCERFAVSDFAEGNNWTEGIVSSYRAVSAAPTFGGVVSGGKSRG